MYFSSSQVMGHTTCMSAFAMFLGISAIDISLAYHSKTGTPDLLRLPLSAVPFSRDIHPGDASTSIHSAKNYRSFRPLSKRSLETRP
ncbi:Hypothetical protein NTJ_15084 [Nesidiocoris tenuis]|uniref:Uncharacterized protein n=1 Tax=Nesidiocoris tenuis TaxID=355587 RepID=A0ABN7BD11_9HEMI|nr:Hypothetical protein NTJ_15084 [Nesidiocoris tenuis]